MKTHTLFLFSFPTLLPPPPASASAALAAALAALAALSASRGFGGSCRRWCRRSATVTPVELGGGGVFFGLELLDILGRSASSLVGSLRRVVRGRPTTTRPGGRGPPEGN